MPERANRRRARRDDSVERLVFVQMPTPGSRIEPPSHDDACYLQWRYLHHKHADSKEGLFHQLASLGVAFAEAHRLRRKFVLPASEFCIPSKHSAMSTLEPGAHSNVQRLTCRAWGELLDLPLLSHFGIHLVAPENVPTRLFGLFANISWTDNSVQVETRYPCGPNTRLITRVTRGFWYMQSPYVNASRLRSQLFAVVDAPMQCPDPWVVSVHRHWTLNYLRSGLFYAPKIKAAAAAIVHALGTPYMAVHLRRGDRLADKGVWGSSSEQRSNMTSALELRGALEAYFPPGIPVYIGSTEPLAFFAPLRGAPFQVFFASNFTEILESNGINDNMALFAVESLVFIGSDKLLETFTSLLPPFYEGCFPALATEARAHQACTEDSMMLGSKACAANHLGVRFGAACVRRPECTLLPRSCPRNAPQQNTTYHPMRCHTPRPAPQRRHPRVYHAQRNDSASKIKGFP